MSDATVMLWVRLVATVTQYTVKNIRFLLLQLKNGCPKISS